MWFKLHRNLVDAPITVELQDDGIQVEPEKPLRRFVPYADIRQVRLSFVSDRFTTDQFVCTIETLAGETLVFGGIAVSFGEWKPSAYRAFVEALHVKLLSGGYRVAFVAGDKTGYFAVRLLWTLCVSVGGLVVVLIFAMNFPWWKFAGVALLYGCLVWLHVRYLRANEPRRYDPRALPRNLLPKGH